MPSPRGCLASFLNLFLPDSAHDHSAAAPPKVLLNRYFISDAEANFFRVLNPLVAGRAHVLAQVSLRQLLYFPGNHSTNPGRSRWQNKSAAKSIDFVLCHPSTLRPLLAIELDEPSHATPHRQSRDEDVELLLRAANLPLIRVLTSRTYDTRELLASIEPHLPR